METNTRQEQTTEGTKGTSELPKITSEIKVKNPLRVAQGKKLAAISREAKARKAREREMSIRKEEVEKCETSYATTTLLSVIGILVVGGGYYFFQRRKKDQQPVNNNNNNEKPSENSNLENF